MTAVITLHYIIVSHYQYKNNKLTSTKTSQPDLVKNLTLKCTFADNFFVLLMGVFMQIKTTL